MDNLPSMSEKLQQSGGLHSIKFNVPHTLFLINDMKDFTRVLF